jgi:hypothetical protein
LLLSFTKWSSRSTSRSVNASSAGPSGVTRFIIVNQKTRQLRIQKTDIRLTRRSAVLSFDSSARQPDFSILWNVSIFHLMAYQSSFSTTSWVDWIGKSVINFQSIFSLPAGFPRSSARMIVKLKAGYRFCFPIGGRTRMRRYFISRVASLTSPFLSRTSMRCSHLTRASLISSAVVWSPLPAKRSTQVRMRKCVPIS